MPYSLLESRNDDEPMYENSPAIIKAWNQAVAQRDGFQHRAVALLLCRGGLLPAAFRTSTVRLREQQYAADSGHRPEQNSCQSNAVMM